MSVFLLKRLVTFVLTLVVASMVVFAVLELLPGNAAQIILGDTATPESLARWVENEQKKGGKSRWAVPRRADQSVAPLSAMQQRMWFVEQLDPGQPVNNSPSAHRLRGALDEQAFNRAFGAMVAPALQVGQELERAFADYRAGVLDRA